MHKPRPVLDALLAWLAEPGDRVRVPGENRDWRIEGLVGELWNSTDTLPVEALERASLPPGCTYGHLVRLLAWQQEQLPDGAGYTGALEALTTLDEDTKQAMFDTLSDLLRAEDRMRTRP